eukprot:COSAG01_NODE_16383_length_1240_cov_2.207713_1_plen_325_part_10
MASRAASTVGGAGYRNGSAIHRSVNYTCGAEGLWVLQPPGQRCSARPSPTPSPVGGACCYLTGADTCGDHPQTSCPDLPWCQTEAACASPVCNSTHQSTWCPGSQPAPFVPGKCDGSPSTTIAFTANGKCNVFLPEYCQGAYQQQDCRYIMNLDNSSDCHFSMWIGTTQCSGLPTMPEAAIPLNTCLPLDAQHLANRGQTFERAAGSDDVVNNLIWTPPPSPPSSKPEPEPEPEPLPPPGPAKDCGSSHDCSTCTKSSNGCSWCRKSKQCVKCSGAIECEIATLGKCTAKDMTTAPSGCPSDDDKVWRPPAPAPPITYCPYENLT